MSIGDQYFLNNLAVYTDTIEKIVLNGETSYIFKMPLSSPHSISFRNLTISTGKYGTKAFIATYTPTRKWIKDRKTKPYISYEGESSFTPLMLESVSLKEALNIDRGEARAKLMSASGKSMLVRTVCNTYIIVTYTPYGCTNGNHMPWDMSCQWNNGSLEVPEGEHAGGYTAQTTSIEQCNEIDMGYDGSGGTGGGGSTTPTPPGEYDPCNNTPTPVGVTFVRGTKLMVTAGTPCDPSPGGPLEPPPPSPLLLYNIYGAILILVGRKQIM